MPIDALFKRGELEDRIQIEDLRLRHGAFDRNTPGCCAEVFRVPNRIAFFSSELIKVVITDHILIRGWSLSRAERTFDSREFRIRESKSARETERNGCPGKKLAPAEVEALRRNGRVFAH
jgi:hypothetical protein